MQTSLRNGARRQSKARDSTFSSEVDLLLGCIAGSRLNDAVATTISRDVNWDVFLEAVVAHGVIAPVYRCLADSAICAVPSPALEALRRRYMANVLQTNQVTRELKEIMGLLAASDVSALAFKGPVLSLLAYGDLAARQYADLDVLVRSRDLRRAIDCLSSEGYTPCAGYSCANMDRAGWFEITLSRPGALAALDLHWRLIPAYLPVTLDGEELWQRAVSVDVDGCAVRTLAPEDQILYLCAHGAKHGWQTLGGISDLARLMGMAPIDWDAMWDRAQRAGARRMLLLGVLLVHDLLDAQVPERLLDAARGERAVLGAARTFIRYAADATSAGPKLYQRWSIPARMIERPGARMRYLASRAFFPSADDRGFVHLPLALAPLYYIVRPLRIALKEGRAAIRGLQPSGAPSADRPAP
jgi:Uncharacterised nucleotidyltransferase